jgi:hypothetical protein
MVMVLRSKESFKVTRANLELMDDFEFAMEVQSVESTERRAQAEATAASEKLIRALETSQGSQAQSGLPAGWFESKTSTGRIYDQNKFTKATTWDRPV